MVRLRNGRGLVVGSEIVLVSSDFLCV